MSIPAEYANREQTYLKHRILRAYLAAWGHKLGSLAKRGGRIKLWYVDCFAGPWQSQDDMLEDTSIYIGLQELRQAAETWRDLGAKVEVGAIFVEKQRNAYSRLHDFVKANSGIVECHTMHGKFGDRVDEIAKLMGRDPAFVFVDPTGFKGVAMKYVSKLVDAKMRDVLINVMFNDINRWKDDNRGFLRAQMSDFFGLEVDLPPSSAKQSCCSSIERI